MKFASVRLVTADLDRLIAFYARLTSAQPVRLAPTFAEVRLPGGAVLALSTEDMIKQFNAGAAVAASNRSAIIEFEVEDVDAEHRRGWATASPTQCRRPRCHGAIARCCCATPTAMW